MKKLSGIISAMITPMDETGHIDFESVKSLTSYLIQNGIDGLYPLGTNGESLSLSEQERMDIADIIRAGAKGSVPVYIQCGSNSLDQTIRLIEHARAIDADGAGIMTPSFFRCDEVALEQYYDAILCKISDFPIYLYNIPSCTGNDITPAILARLMQKYENVQGIKYSSDSYIRYLQYLTITNDALIGCDSLILNCLMAGGVGAVSGPCSAFPELFSKLYDEFNAGHYESARELQKRIITITQYISHMPELPTIKMILKWRGIIKHESCRAPFRKLASKEVAYLEKLFDTYAIQK